MHSFTSSSVSGFLLQKKKQMQNDEDYEFGVCKKTIKVFACKTLSYGVKWDHSVEVTGWPSPMSSEKVSFKPNVNTATCKDIKLQSRLKFEDTHEDLPTGKQTDR